MVQIDADNLLSAAQQLELTKLAVVSLLIAIVLMFSVTVFALVMFGRKSNRHAGERDKNNRDWQATITGVAKEFTAEFMPLVRAIGDVTLAVGSLQRDMTGSVEGMSTSVSDLATQVGLVVKATETMRTKVENSEKVRDGRYAELFRRESDTAQRMDRLEKALQGVTTSLQELARRIPGGLNPRDRRTIRALIGQAELLISRFTGNVETLKEVENAIEQLETSTAGGAADAAGADRPAAAGAGGDAAGVPDDHVGGGDAGADA